MNYKNTKTMTRGKIKGKKREEDTWENNTRRMRKKVRKKKEVMEALDEAEREPSSPHNHQLGYIVLLSIYIYITW